MHQCAWPSSQGPSQSLGIPRDSVMSTSTARIPKHLGHQPACQLCPSLNQLSNHGRYDRLALLFVSSVQFAPIVSDSAADQKKHICIWHNLNLMSCKIILTPDLIILRHILMDVASHGFHGFCSDTVHLAPFDVLEPFLLAHPYQDTHIQQGVDQSLVWRTLWWTCLSTYVWTWKFESESLGEELTWCPQDTNSIRPLGQIQRTLFVVSDATPLLLEFHLQRCHEPIFWDLVCD